MIFNELEIFGRSRIKVSSRAHSNYSFSSMILQKTETCLAVLLYLLPADIIDCFDDEAVHARLC